MECNIEHDFPVQCENCEKYFCPECQDGCGQDNEGVWICAECMPYMDWSE